MQLEPKLTHIRGLTHPPHTQRAQRLHTSSVRVGGPTPTPFPPPPTHTHSPSLTPPIQCASASAGRQKRWAARCCTLCRWRETLAPDSGQKSSPIPNPNEASAPEWAGEAGNWASRSWRASPWSRTRGASASTCCSRAAATAASQEGLGGGRSDFGVGHHSPSESIKSRGNPPPSNHLHAGQREKGWETGLCEVRSATEKQVSEHGAREQFLGGGGVFATDGMQPWPPPSAPSPPAGLW